MVILRDVTPMIIDRLLCVMLLSPMLMVAINILVVMLNRYLNNMSCLMVTLSVLIWSLFSHLISDHWPFIVMVNHMMRILFVMTVVMLSDLYIMTMVLVRMCISVVMILTVMRFVIYNMFVAVTAPEMVGTFP